MNTETGKLIVQGKRIMVELPTKKGVASFPIPSSAKAFRDSDAEHGLEVIVTRDTANRITKVVIPGKPEVTASSASFPSGSQGRTQHDRGRPQGQQPFNRPGPRQQAASPNPSGRNKSKAPAKVIGQPFHNPYTFMKFEGNPERIAPTQLTADELPATEDHNRISGVLQLQIETLSPLLICNPKPVDKDSETPEHKIYEAMSIGEEVIVPATGIRGALRTLLTILTSGTLSYADPNGFLIQGRDCNLGPANRFTHGKVPSVVHLGLVIQPGSVFSRGKIQLGETKLVRLQSLKDKIGERNLDRNPEAEEIWIELDNSNNPVSWAKKRTPKCQWRLRLSGKPVGGFRREQTKREAVFRPGNEILEIREELWSEYAGRNQFGIRPLLERNDLVWLELSNEAAAQVSRIRSELDIESFQWARWGRSGRKFLEESIGNSKPKISKEYWPDSRNEDGKVDQVTDLFGQVPGRDLQDKVVAYAARIRPDNLVFNSAKSDCQRVTLAPLAPPHPGCAGFYLAAQGGDNVAKADQLSFDNDSLKGYKVYRTTTQVGDDAPWHYHNQGVFTQLRLGKPNQKTNKTVDLLPAGKSGSLQIAFRALKLEELALLVQACSIPWRLGGGKPFGLGACRVTIARVLDEFGRATSIDELLGRSWKEFVPELVQRRAQTWIATQRPVPFLRYPRAIRQQSRGGHAWFQTFSRPKMASPTPGEERKPGMMALPIGGELLRTLKQQGVELNDLDPTISAQVLPDFDPDDIMADVLYGYDVEAIASTGDRNVYQTLKPVNEPTTQEKMSTMDAVRGSTFTTGAKKNLEENRQ